ncbi:DEAD/DEAH box helicase, partial [Cohnella sp. REN36]|nr:DEAD/DEAH box helicase [Cohnella sp. REN36]
TGIAATFDTPREIGQLRTIEKASKGKIHRKLIPTVEEAMESKQKMASEKMIELLKEGNYGPFKQTASELLDEYDSITL